MGRPKQSHCKRDHELSGDNVTMVGGYRRCRACARIHQQEWRDRQSAEAERIAQSLNERFGPPSFGW